MDTGPWVHWQRAVHTEAMRWCIGHCLRLVVISLMIGKRAAVSADVLVSHIGRQCATKLRVLETDPDHLATEMSTE